MLLQKAKKKSKHGSKKVVRVVNGSDVVFDSMKEARRFDELYLLARKGLITDLIIQPEFLLMKAQRHNGITYKSVKYVADFSYMKDGKKIVEDVKSDHTRKLVVYRVKIKFFIHLYGDSVTFLES